MGGPRLYVGRELPWGVTLAVCMPANDRMDDLVEKAAELGVARIVPLMSERSVLRLQGERAAKKQAHWQGVAVAACEQCGRNRVPVVEPVQALGAFLSRPKDERAGVEVRWQLSLEAHALSLGAAWAGCAAAAPGAGRAGVQGSASHSTLREEMRLPPALTVLSGPEGGLSPLEQSLALAAGFTPVSLGPRTLRADTAPLAALAAVAVPRARRRGYRAPSRRHQTAQRVAVSRNGPEADLGTHQRATHDSKA